VEEDEPNFYSEIMSGIERAGAEGASPAEMVALRAAMEIAWGGRSSQNYWIFWRKKKVMTQEERAELIASTRKTLEQMSKATAEKYPVWAKGVDKFDKEHP
jgi:hypothetical protein